MQSKIDKYSSEIRSFLEERNIFYDKNTDYNFNYIGIIRDERIKCHGIFIIFTIIT